MLKLATRFVGIIVGLAVPLLAWGLVEDTGVSHVSIDAESAIDIATMPQQNVEKLDYSLLFGPDLAEQNEGQTDSAEKTDEVATACCWIYLFGRWWCVPCG